MRIILCEVFFVYTVIRSKSTKVGTSLKELG